MVKKFLIGLILFLGVIITLVFTPLGYRLGLTGPKNYNECVAAGGETNKEQTRIMDVCYYKGKSFSGGNI